VIAGALVAWLALAGSQSADAQLESIFAEEKYAFCHDAHYPITDDEAAWCPILAKGETPMCPAFPSTCAGHRAELLGPAGRLARREVVEEKDAEPRRGDGGSGPGRVAAPPEPEAELPALGGLAQVLFWAIVIAGAIAIIAAIVSHAVGRRQPLPDPERVVPPIDDAPAPAETRARLPADIETLLRAAEEAERRGDLPLAVDYGHAALLRRLDHEGVIHLHRSRTTGDYLGDLREHPDWRGRAAPVLRDIDRAQFRASGPDASLTRSILTRVFELARSVAGTAVVLVLLVSIAIACATTEGSSHPWNPSPSGTDAVIELLERNGRDVRWRTSELGELEEGETIVLLDGAAPSEAEWAALHDWVRTRGGTLVIADGGVWPHWIGAQPVGSPYAAVEPDAEPSGHIAGDAGLELGDSRWMVLFERNYGPYAVERQLGAGTIVALADSHLFTNAALALGHTEVLDVLVRNGDVVLVDALTGSGADSPMESIERSHLTAAMVQLFLLVLAILLWRGWPFGRPRDPAPPPRRGFVDHARAMGLQYASARASTHASALYAAWALETMRRDGAATHGAGLHGLAQAVAQRTGRDETEVMRLLVDAHGAAEAGNVGNNPEDLQLLRELVRLVREGGGRR
jgi:hypothetical protein